MSSYELMVGTTRRRGIHSTRVSGGGSGERPGLLVPRVRDEERVRLGRRKKWPGHSLVLRAQLRMTVEICADGTVRTVPPAHKQTSIKLKAV